MFKQFFIFIFIAFMTTALQSCKAKTCDAANNVIEDKSSRKSKNVGLFSKKERRRARW
jgi:hypothetical protein